MNIREASNQIEWDSFLQAQPWSPFLQSWTMGEVYSAIGQEPIRLEVRDKDGKIAGICQGITVPARRGWHLMVQYGPVVSADSNQKSVISDLAEELKRIGKEKRCSFIRVSPFWSKDAAPKISETILSPLHLLAEHIWYLPLTEKTEESLLKGMRKTTRNLIRRAEKDGVTIEASRDPIRDLPHFLKLHDETRRRHSFTSYTQAFFESQVKHFSKRNEVTLYLARYQGEIIAASIHMHACGETSYHHGASSSAFSKIPASYLLQWRAIQDALARGDHIYNFWGIAPPLCGGNQKFEIRNSKHPFAGVTLFKTGFGGELLSLVPCMDIPLSRRYYLTRSFELLRKWRRGF